MKNVSKLGKALTKTEQKEITGGWGCQAQLILCETDFDCPFCSSGCGLTTTLPDGSTIFFDDLCAF